MTRTLHDYRSANVWGACLLFGMYWFLSNLVCWSWMHQPASLLDVWQVSSFGRVRNRRGQVSTGTIRADGCLCVRINIRYKGRMFLVHRLVCQTFLGLPPTPAHTHVNHKNGNKRDNRVSNLEYATPSENVLHSFALDGHNRAPGRVCKPVLGRQLGSNEWTQYASMEDASINTGLSTYRIRKCCRSEHLTAAGYQFQFATPMSPSSLVGEVWRGALDPGTGEAIRGWQVSSLGRCNSTRGFMNWGSLFRDGYRHACLRIGGTLKGVLVHRLVARAFLGPPPKPDHAYVNHKDCNKTNNAIENLEYVTARGNMKHFHASMQGMNCRYKSGRSQSKPVRARRRGCREWSTFESMTTAEKRLGLYRGSISSCCSRRTARYKGYEFECVPAAVPDVLPGEEWRDVELD